MLRVAPNPPRANVLKLPEALTQTTATRSLRELQAALRGESAPVVVDAASLSRFDSTALAVLLELRREALQLGKPIAIQGLPPRLEDLARLYGIAELLSA
jgi:phospholipid transport system transporter-binding protein